MLVQLAKCVWDTCVQLSVAAPQQVAELLALFVLAVTPLSVEAQLLHQHQRLLTQVFIPVPRHAPILIALPPQQSADGSAALGALTYWTAPCRSTKLARPPFNKVSAEKDDAGSTRRNQRGVLVLITETRVRCP
ncbi:hypothetical protein GOODEAATRI_007947 [Goodea atripinnis]|uniref:Secreted protein n=1 Tax=Goodea atripinnis TaxID=208336 RepID=A0ABV0N8V8_9TELE